MKGLPFNAKLRDVVIGFKTEDGNECSVYSPDKVDPLVRRDRGMAELFIHASDARIKYRNNILAIQATATDQNNHVMIDKMDAYLLNLLNERENHSLFNHAKIGIAAQD